MKCVCGGKSKLKTEGQIYVGDQLTGETLYQLECNRCEFAVCGTSQLQCEALWVAAQKDKKRRMSREAVIKYKERSGV